MADAAVVTQYRLTHRQILTVYSGLMLGMVVAGLSQMIVTTALPTIVGELGGLEFLSWVVTAHLLTSTAATPLYGKISDLVGRRRVFQAAILIFLGGSILCGLAQNMPQLIAFRAIQGAGSGGLMAMSMVITGDIVSPRERGRYQGYMGAAWALVSLVGPLIGGFIVDNLSWRWCFFVVLPVGVAALIVTNRVLKLPFRRVEHRIDYLGAGLLVGSVTTILLVSALGGTVKFPWSSPTIILLGAAAIVLTASFLIQETRTPEPILPLRLFKNSVFTVTTINGVIVGVAMFGSWTFLPVWLQVVTGASPTASGLMVVPMMGGMMLTSITSGRLITRTGRYKIFPVVGSALLGVGIFLLSTLTPGTGRVVTASYFFLMGTGIGMVMQVLVLAVQNAVEQRDLGIATASSQFFRQMGGTMGTAVFGAILTSRLAYHLPRLVSPEALGSIDPARLRGSPRVIYSLPPGIRDGVIEAFARSLHSVFLAAVPLAVIGFVVILFLKEHPLRENPHVGFQEVGEELGMIADAEAEDQVSHADGQTNGRGRSHPAAPNGRVVPTVRQIKTD